MAEPRTDSERLTVVELVTAQNAEAITKITQAIEKLSEVVMSEDKNIRDTLKLLSESSIKCELRHDTFIEFMAQKRQAVQELRSKIDSKADKKELTELKKSFTTIAWKIFWAALTALTTVLLAVATYVVNKIPMLGG